MALVSKRLLCNYPSFHVTRSENTMDTFNYISRMASDIKHHTIDTTDFNDNCNKPQLLWQVQNRQGYSPLRLYHPYDVTFLRNQKVCVVEGFFPYSRLQIVDQGQGRCTNISGQGEIMPYGVTSDHNGNLAVTDHKDRTVKFFSEEGNLTASWKPDMFDWPDGIAVTKTGKFVVTDWSRGVISEHDVDGTRLHQFHTVNTNAGTKHSCPTYLTIDSCGRYIITDTFDKSVKIFSPEGTLLHHFGHKHSGKSGEPFISDPRGITTDTNGNIVVADWGDNALLLYNPQGHYQRHLLTAEDGISSPWGVAIDKSGHLLVSQHKMDKKPALKLYQYPS